MKHTATRSTEEVMISFRVPRAFRDFVKHRSIQERLTIRDILMQAVERDRARQHLTTPDELFAPEFMIRLEKKHLSRADYYDA